MVVVVVVQSIGLKFASFVWPSFGLIGGRFELVVWLFVIVVAFVRSIPCRMISTSLRLHGTTLALVGIVVIAHRKLKWFVWWSFPRHGHVVKRIGFVECIHLIVGSFVSTSDRWLGFVVVVGSSFCIDHRLVVVVVVGVLIFEFNMVVLVGKNIEVDVAVDFDMVVLDVVNNVVLLEVIDSVLFDVVVVTVLLNVLVVVVGNVEVNVLVDVDVVRVVKVIVLVDVFRSVGVIVLVEVELVVLEKVVCVVVVVLEVVEIDWTNPTSDSLISSI